MLLVRNGNVYLGGGRYKAGRDLLCEGGVIKEIGPGLRAEGAQVIDAEGKDVYPGLVLGLCAVGAVSFSEQSAWDVNEAATPMVPQMDIRDAFDLRELKLQRFGRAGITSYGLTPGTKALLAGQISLVHVDGNRTEDVFLAERIALKGNYTQSVKQAFKDKGAPQTRMAMYQMLDEAFRAAREYKDKDEKDYDAGKEVLSKVLSCEIPFVVSAATQGEIESVIRLGRKYNLRLVITGAFGVQKHADEIMAQGWHVMLGDSNSMMEGIKNETSHSALVDFYRKGLKLSIFCSGDTAYPAAYEQLLWVAAQMSAAGAKGYEIMDMMTVMPAQALGVDHLVGSLEVGKQADIIICRGNPAVRFDNFVDHTIVAGKHFYAREGK